MTGTDKAASRGEPGRNVARPPASGREQLVAGAPVPLYQQLSDLLREAIRRGDYGPLERLSSEHELVREYSISRITARQALAELERAGLVFRRQGRGSFVARPAVVQPLRQLTGLAEAMAGQGLTSRSRVLRAATVRASTQVAQALRVEVGAAVFEIRRVRRVDGVPVSLDVSFFPPELGRRLAGEDLERRDIFWLIENACALVLGAADCQIGAVAAEGEPALQLGVPSGSPLLFIDRLTHDDGGRPIDYEHLYVRADRFRYALHLERRPDAKETPPA
jgi:GntR family transcriptional regulator